MKQLKLCKHDWTGDDACAYCRVEELEDIIVERDKELERVSARSGQSIPSDYQYHRDGRE